MQLGNRLTPKFTKDQSFRFSRRKLALPDYVSRMRRENAQTDQSVPATTIPSTSGRELRPLVKEIVDLWKNTSQRKKRKTPLCQYWCRENKLDYTKLICVVLSWLVFLSSKTLINVRIINIQWPLCRKKKQLYTVVLSFSILAAISIDQTSALLPIFRKNIKSNVWARKTISCTTANIPA